MKPKIITIQPFMYERLKLAESEIIIYAVVYGCGENGYTDTIKTLMNITGKSKPATIAALRNLVTRGILTKEAIPYSQIFRYKAVLPEGVAYLQPINERQVKIEALKVFFGATHGYLHEVHKDYDRLLEKNAPIKDLYHKKGEAYALENICRSLTGLIADMIEKDRKEREDEHEGD